MHHLVLQNANEGAVSSLLNAFLRSIDTLLATEEVRTLLGWFGAMLVVGVCILMMRVLVGRAVKKSRLDLAARQAEQNALDATEAPKA
ncbi:hypothetical protein [Methylocapsa palsarum]|uniref:Uncharacterized protein n=1 Tax=Methylocapsa palsarum TaxID=1612308 RepID=A0A1I3WQA4_9HYPH|nr:hypothetical protein [Methylocapsa palsarum]SFK09642.1 hypothetical protein SAMN05444581_10257 [Methylocapsa palsarum]